MKRRTFHRAAFAAAGVYNIAWGLYSALRPEWLFQWAAMEPPRYPEIFACLGMVVGLYGVLYLQVARRPDADSSRLIAAVGLAGKIFGPLGWVSLYSTGQWPLAPQLPAQLLQQRPTPVLVLTNDVLWWLPFGLYLFDSRAAAWRG